MPAPDSIRALCETFALHREHYTSGGYNETELRREFLDPFFTALGWDVDNKAGYADAYKDIIHEDAIRIGGYDLYALFIEKGIKLLRDNGSFGYITPNTWLNNEHYSPLRTMVCATTEPNNIGDFRDVKVFADATVLPIVFTSQKARQPDIAKPVVIERYSSPHNAERFLSSPKVWASLEGNIFNLSLSEADVPLVQKIGQNPALALIANCRFGVKVYQKGKGSPKQSGEEAKEDRFVSASRNTPEFRPYARGRSIQSWFLSETLTWLDYGPHLAEPRSIELFEGARIILRRIVGERLIQVPVFESVIADQLLHTVKLLDTENSSERTKVLAGIFGSRLMAYYFKKRYNRDEKTFPEIRVGELNSLPIRRIDCDNPSDVALHDKMVLLVERMLDLNKKKAAEKNPNILEQLETQISATDRQIDRLTYQLYNLTEAEIAIVERD